MKVRQIRHIIILGLMALVGIVTIQAYWLLTTWHMQQEKLDEKIWLALKNTMQQINVLHDCLPNDLNPVQQMTETCYMVDVSCEYNQTNLEHLIHSQFNKLDVNIEHELAIYNCNKNELEYIGKFSGSGEKINASGDLNECFIKGSSDLVYFFCINISGRTDYLFSKMRLWILLSLVVLVIVLFFTYTIFSFFKQKQLAELQKDFINNMTHEFKTPISTINIASDVLLGFDTEQVPDRYKKYAAIIKQENERLNHQVENVLQAARIEKGKTPMNYQKWDLHQLLDEVFNEGFLKSQTQHVELQIHKNARYATIWADRLHVTNILFNLTDNALKYNHSGKILIQINTANEGKYLLMKFADNGMGILPKYQKKVFQKFFRVPTGNIHDVKGFGLGLFYVKQVCDAHHWKISCQSELEKGTVFIFKIPYLVSDGKSSE